MIRAYVAHAQYGGAVAISLVLHGAEPDIPRRILRVVSSGEGDEYRMHTEWHQFDPYDAVPPTLTLGHDEAIALMEALRTHYSGVDDARMLRSDYDKERGRVDDLLKVVSEVALGRAA
jgi:hypothetical protein